MITAPVRFFVCLPLMLQLCFAQTGTDSALTLLQKSGQDTARLRILNYLAENLDPGDWEKYNMEMKTLAEKLGRLPDKKISLKARYFLATAIHNIGYAHSIKSNYSEALEYYQQAMKLREEIGDSTGIAGSLTGIGFVYNKTGKINEALNCFFKSLSIQQRRNDERAMAFNLNDIGAIYDDKGNPQAALDYYNKSVSIWRKLGDQYGEASTLGNIASVYHNMGQMEKALAYYNQSMAIREKINDQRGIANIINNIGVLYEGQGMIKEAFSNYLKSLEIKQKIGDKFGQASTLNNIGYLFSGKEPEKALVYYNKALDICTEINLMTGIARAYNNIGSMKSKLGQKEEALRMYQLGLKYREQIDDKPGVSNSLSNIGNHYLEKREYRHALPYLDRAHKIAIELGYPEKIVTSALQLYRLFKQTGENKKALEMYELHVKMRDSLSNEQTKKLGLKNQLKYEYEKKSAADSVKNAELQKVKDAELNAQSAKLKQEKTQFWFVVCGLLFVVVGLFFVWNRFRITQRQKKIIEKQKIQVDEAFEKLNEKNKEVLDSIHYAKRIQTALVTSEKYIHRKLNAFKKIGE